MTRRTGPRRGVVDWGRACLRVGGHIADLLRTWATTALASHVRESYERYRRRLLAEPLENRRLLSAAPQLLEDLSTYPADSNPSEFIEANGTVFFVAADNVFRRRLWKTDGTPEGTTRVSDRVSTAWCQDCFATVNGTLFFAGEDDAHGSELWKSDGTEAGTVLVADLRSGTTGSYPQWFAERAGALYVTASNGLQDLLWRSDGTTTTPVVAAPSWFNLYYLTNVHGTLYFYAYGPSSHELWRSDGTADGTKLVARFPSGLNDLTAVGGTLYFSVVQGNEAWELWRSNGTASGTQRIKTFPQPANYAWRNLTDVRGRLYFTADDGISGHELWKSDGTERGTVMVADLQPGSEGTWFGSLVASHGKLYFNSYGENGWTLWTSDGSATRTRMIRVGQQPVSAYSLFDRNGALYVGGADGLVRIRTKSAGRVTVEQLHTSFFSESLAWANGALYFAARDETHGVELWKYDETAGGSVLVKDLNPGTASTVLKTTAVRDGTVYFSVSGYGSLWRSDGTEAGTVPIVGWPLNSIVVWQGPVNVHGSLYFAGRRWPEDQALWTTDGTTAGTSVVKYIPSSEDWVFPKELTDVNGTLFFITRNGPDSHTLWKSDGTAAGTVPVRDVPISMDRGYLTSVNGRLYFVAGETYFAQQLWSSDGTEAGTVPLELTSATSRWYGPADLANLNGTLYFTAEDSDHGRELWKTDGTLAGTVLVKDIWPGSESSYPTALAGVGGTLYFSADDGVHGSELWKTDGTAAGTVLVSDVRPGSI